MVDVLWEVAYGVFKEALCVNSVEDFNTTKADLMELKDDILATWKSRDKHRTSSLGPTFTPSSAWASEKKSRLGDTFSSSSAMVPKSICLSIFSGLSYGLGGNSVTSCEALRPTTRDPVSLGVYALQAGYHPHSKPFFVGINYRIQLLSHDRATFDTIDPK